LWIKTKQLNSICSKHIISVQCCRERLQCSPLTLTRCQMMMPLLNCTMHDDMVWHRPLSKQSWILCSVHIVLAVSV